MEQARIYKNAGANVYMYYLDAVFQDWWDFCTTFGPVNYDFKFESIRVFSIIEQKYF